VQQVRNTTSRSSEVWA